MKFHYAGKYNGDPESLPSGEHHPGAVIYREPDEKKFAIIANVGALALAIITMAIYFSRAKLFGDAFEVGKYIRFIGGFVLSMVVLVPHEFLHALCFREDVYMYTWLQKGLLFVFGREPMTRAHFIFMSMLPNIVFGFVPFALFLCNPGLILLGALGAMSIPAGFGDYINVFNTLTQVPKGCLVYMHGFHTYWYRPEN